MLLSKKKYEIIEEDRQFADYLPPVSVFLGGIIFLAGTIVAIMLYETPNGGYQITNQFLSELGLRNDYVVQTADGTTETRYAPPYPDIFNFTLYASGFLIMPFFFFSFRQMRNENRISNFFLIFGTTFGFISGPILIMVGVFDLGYPSSVIWQEHQFWAGLFYLFIAITSVCWLVMLLTSRHLPYRTTKWIFLDYFFLVLLALLTLFSIAAALDVINPTQIPFDEWITIELYQKLMAFLFFIYFGLVVGTRLTKTKYDNTPVIPPDEVLDNLSTNSSKYAEEMESLDKKSSGDPIYCTECGNENLAESPYCTDCGIKLE